MRFVSGYFLFYFFFGLQTLFPLFLPSSGRTTDLVLPYYCNQWSEIIQGNQTRTHSTSTLRGYNSHKGIGLASREAAKEMRVWFGAGENGESERHIEAQYFPNPPAECMPDTLYSWTTEIKLDKKLNPLKEASRKQIPQRMELYTWRTPLGSYGYGSVSIRIKLKSDVHFVYWPSFSRPPCHEKLKYYVRANKKQNIPYHTYDPPRNLVFVRFEDGSSQGTDLSGNPTRKAPIFSWAEFDLCSTDAVESVSMFYPEHLVEMKDELSWMRKHRFNPGTLFFYEEIFDEEVFIDANLLKLEQGPRWGPEKLEENIKLMAKKTIESGSAIFFDLNQNDEVKTTEEAIEEHFKTDKPIYFNPY